ncbi:TFIIH complex kinase subunit CCL1 NDAI_0A01380 [Naumovozyma dairenensis CBS 421]|uniref:Cyclin-like domain-containing protein n=1 Tax=Naumovozyma dairenensis (strain ATCC 10597 / BCRC 20456 / CBS 421 / NBRC 0211 / NRRL Y-12639) TaxID=1071378 RepID=G0W3A8_NAUDC|nr:hypothetical protein NDAI_0A01380 [Naumovozyma dairenensis CBS 421]CCD22296.1 hypothetical protein NDAI_0A01380 [Naumovozyma dairenensis CBS 421]
MSDTSPLVVTSKENTPAASQKSKIDAAGTEVVATDGTTESEDSNKPLNYNRITDDELYRHSSQYRFWSFSKEHLREKRDMTNKLAVETIEKDLFDFKALNDLTPEELNALDTKAVPLTTEEELKLIDFYAKKVQVISQHLNLPTEIIATSISFFRKFFLENSVMQFDPKNLVHTTVFLACKAENYFISVDSFAKKAKSTRESILKYEFKLLESLKFTLLIHHPYKPLHGFFLDIQNILHGKVDLNYMGQIYDRTKKKITQALLTDAVYLYTPPQITLAVLLIEDEPLITKYLELKFADNDNDDNGNEVKRKKKNSIDLTVLLSVIKECKDVIENLQTVSTEDARKIAAKNYFCQNPKALIQNLKRKQQQAGSSTEPEQKKQRTE